MPPLLLIKSACACILGQKGGDRDAAEATAAEGRRYRGSRQPLPRLGGDASIIWRYELGVRRLREAFSLRVIPAPHALKGSDYLRRHPEARAEDLLWAFENPEVRGILANVGGNDSHRLLPLST